MEVCVSNGDCHPNSHCNKPWGRKLPCELKEKNGTDSGEFGGFLIDYSSMG